MTNNPMELQYLGSPTRPTSSGLLGSGSSINPCSNKDVNKSSTSSWIFFFLFLFIIFIIVWLNQYMKMSFSKEISEKGC